jgi:hypothetical protein
MADKIPEISAVGEETEGKEPVLCFDDFGMPDEEEEDEFYHDTSYTTAVFIECDDNSKVEVLSPSSSDGLCTVPIASTSRRHGGDVTTDSEICEIAGCDDHGDAKFKMEHSGGVGEG